MSFYDIYDIYGEEIYWEKINKTNLKFSEINYINPKEDYEFAILEAHKKAYKKFMIKFINLKSKNTLNLKL